MKHETITKIIIYKPWALVALVWVLFLTSCSKEVSFENAAACSATNVQWNEDNSITWSGTAPFVVQRYDMYGYPMQTDTVTVMRKQYEYFMIGYVRVRPLCSGSWSRYVYLAG